MKALGHGNQASIFLFWKQDQIAYGRFSVETLQKVSVRSTAGTDKGGIYVNDQAGKGFTCGVNGLMDLPVGKQNEASRVHIIAGIFHKILDVSVHEQIDFMAVMHVKIHIPGNMAGGKIAAEGFRKFAVMVKAFLFHGFLLK
jgi:hypothetical protein